MALDVILLYDVCDRGGNNPGKNSFGESTLATIERIASKHEPDFILLDEFRGTSEQVKRYASRLSNIAQYYESSIVMAPDHYWSSHEKKWHTFAEELQQAGIQVEGFVEGGYSPASVGFYFGKNGSVYAFPKQWEKKPIHRIPSTDIAVVICGEINHLKPDMLDGISLLLNPSLEGDDPTMGLRDMLAAGVPEKEALIQLQRHYGLEDAKALESTRGPPSYARHLHDAMQRNGILGLRSDYGRFASGILCLPPGLSLVEYSTFPNPEYDHIWGDRQKSDSLHLPFGLALARDPQILNRKHTEIVKDGERKWQSMVLSMPFGVSLVKQTTQEPAKYTYLRFEKS